jgi:hypothetical protein
MGVTRSTIALLAAVGMASSASAVSAGPAGAYSNPNYPGSTLALALSGPSLPGQVTTIVATGTNTLEEIGGYQLDAYAKVPAIDHTCANTSSEEKSTIINEPSEAQIGIGLSEGFGPFSVQVKAQFLPGPKLICAYSLWSYDTAVSAQLTFTTGEAGSGSTQPAPTTTTVPAAYTKAVAKCKKRYGGASKKHARAKCIAAARHRFHVK